MLEESDFEAGDRRADVLASEGAIGERGEAAEVVGGLGLGEGSERGGKGEP